MRDPVRPSLARSTLARFKREYEGLTKNAPPSNCSNIYIIDVFRKSIFELSEPGPWEQCHTYHRNRFC